MMGPSFSLMPYLVTMARAILVARSMSLLAPVEMSSSTRASASRFLISARVNSPTPTSAWISFATAAGEGCNARRGKSLYSVCANSPK